MMKEEDAIDLLRHYRHDWLNQVQLLMGYASMGKLDKVEAKLKESIEVAGKERKLESLEIPKTTLWLISFNWHYDNFRMDYEVCVNNTNLSAYDQQLHSLMTSVMRLLQSHSDKMELYKGTMIIQDSKELSTEIVVTFSGKFMKIDELKEQLLEINELHKVTMKEYKKEKFQCTLTCICN